MAAQITMRPVYAIATNVTSAMGLDTAAHWQKVMQGRTGLASYTDAALSATPFWASKLDAGQWQMIQAQTASSDVTLSPFEQMAIYSAKRALQECEDTVNLAETVLILSTTKGNIEWLKQVPDDRIQLTTSAHIITKELGLTIKPVIISHACVSGVVALTYGLRLLQSGRYKHAIVVGCDRFSKFVLSGFQSFQAIADEPCKPFDANRKGINLGEAAATIVLSTVTGDTPMAQLLSGATSNDANHISGPSRTGEELSMAINKAMSEAAIPPSQIDMISAHGTATIYNDEMEAKAFGLSNLLHSPVHSFKGYIGHTLGAAGVLESAMIIESLRHQQLIPSPGYSQTGVSQPLNVTTEATPGHIHYVLKTASGFGGCNAAVVWAKAD